MKETELVDQLLQREDNALEQLRLHYGPLIRYIIAPILSDPRDREEAFDDVLLRVWDRINQYDPRKGSFKNWLSTISRNAAIDRLRRLTPEENTLDETFPSKDTNPEQALLAREQQKALKRALQGLKDEELELFYRKYYYRQSTAQIAAEQGTSLRAIEGRLYRIKQKLRKQLGGDGYEP